MDPNQEPPSIHHRRRWYYVLWAALLVTAAGFLGWWETPARQGTARVRFVLKAPDLPPGTRAALWTGTSRAWKPDWNPGGGWYTGQAGLVGAGPTPLRIAHRRLGQGLLMRRTQDLAIVVLEAPSGERRYLVYDLREDLSTVLLIGRSFTVEVATTWSNLARVPLLPPDETRKVVGH